MAKQNEELKETLKKYFAIKTPCIWIDTFEENIAVTTVYQAIKETFPRRGSVSSYDLIEWTEGFGGIKINSDNFLPKRINRPSDNNQPLNFDEEPDPANFEDIAPAPAALLQCINAVQNDVTKKDHPFIFVAKEISDLSRNPSLARMIRDLKESRGMDKKTYSPIIIVSPSSDIPYSLQKLFVSIKFALPDKDFIKELITIFLTNPINKASIIPKDYAISDEEKEDIAAAACGLSSIEMTRAFKLSMISNQKLDKDYILREKIQTIQKSGILTYKEPKVSIDDVGGHTNLKDWIKEVKLCMTKEAEDFGIKNARGYLSIGVPGGGKTMLAEAVANYFEVPFVTLDLSKIMGGIVGESERNARQAFEVIDSIGRCVILIDECEKALGGIQSSNRSDGGTMARVFGVILQHLNDNKNQFYILTSNKVTDLPPELSRSGRLDNKWFFDFPSEKDRYEIFNIHFKKSNKNIDPELLNYAVKNSEYFTGAEIENAVNNIIKNAFFRLKSGDGTGIIDKKDIITGISKINTTYSTCGAEIKSLQTYVQKNHIPSTCSSFSHVKTATDSMINYSGNNDETNGKTIQELMFDK